MYITQGRSLDYYYDAFLEVEMTKKSGVFFFQQIKERSLMV